MSGGISAVKGFDYQAVVILDVLAEERRPFGCPLCRFPIRRGKVVTDGLRCSCSIS